jgi:hypothetical protein
MRSSAAICSPLETIRMAEGEVTEMGSFPTLDEAAVAIGY